MKATGEVMAIGRNIEESLLKAVRSLEIGVFHNEMTEAIEADDEKLYEKMVKTQDDRLFYVSEAIRCGIPIEEIADLTKIDIFFLDKLLHIVEIENQLKVNISNNPDSSLWSQSPSPTDCSFRADKTSYFFRPLLHQ